MISAQSLTRTFYTHKKAPGFLASVKSLFKRDWIEKQALQNVSLTVKEGEILGLLGANGAGKTTLVKILAGIITPTSGQAKVIGYTPWERDVTFRKQIALIMGQKAQLWWDLPAADCFELLKDVYELSEAAYQEQLLELVELLHVGQILHTPIRNLSLGERMKMELIAALLHRPRVIFLDEPTIGLDFSAQRAVRRFIREYSQRHKPAIILTSHYMEDIEALCKRIVILRQGKLVYDGNLSEIQSLARSSRSLHISLEDGYVTPAHWKHGELLSASPETLTFKVQPEAMNDLIVEILANGRVSDIRVEEEDVSRTIERIMKGQQAA